LRSRATAALLSVVIVGARTMGWATAAAAALGAAAGASWMAAGASLFERFGAQEIAPMAVALVALRGWSVWGGLIAPAVALAGVLHRQGLAEKPAPVTWVDVALAGATPLVVYACAALAIEVGAFAAWWGFGYGAAPTFWRRFAETAALSDLELGVGLSLAHGVLVAAAARTTASAWTSRAWGLVPKLLAAGGGALVLLFVEGIALGVALR
jgi:hypothetical protein